MKGPPRWHSGKESACQAGDMGSILGSGGSPGEEKWQSTEVSLAGRSHRQKSLVGYSPWDGRVRHNLVTKQQQYMKVPARA